MSQEQAQHGVSSWKGRGWLIPLVFLVAVGVGLALSKAAIFATVNGPLMIVLSAAWALAAGVAGTRIRRWSWVIACPGAMLGLVLLWELVYGRESWRSLYVFMLGVVFAASALVGAISGVWFGKRRESAESSKVASREVERSRRSR